MISDLTGIDTSSLPGFNLGFRCKALTVCSPEESCIYYTAKLGSIQSTEATDAYADGAELAPAVATKIGIDVGAASQCGNPPLQIVEGESIVLSFDGTSLRVFFPKVIDTAVVLFVRSDGATFYDAALTQLAYAPPAP
jgi:hypothetical protein